MSFLSEQRNSRKRIMLKIILIILVFSFVACNSFARELEIQPEYNDLNPGDGFMDAGSKSNPYVISSGGRDIGTISPKYMDLNDGDGFMDAGSRANPYIIDDER